MSNKASIEFRNAHVARAARKALLKAVKIDVVSPRVEQAPPFTLHQLDLFKLRSEARRDALLVHAIAVFGKKKKLPLPTTGIFACENLDDNDCGEAGHAEGRCGNAACIKQLRPRVVA